MVAVQARERGSAREAHVRFGSEADICAAKRYVRYYTESRHSWNGRADIVSLRSA